MKEIELRYWDNKKKKWLIVGKEMVMTGKQATIPGLKLISNNSGTWEIYTGLTDKTGKKIFDGDIVKIKCHWSPSVKLIRVVEWIGSSIEPFGNDDYGWNSKKCNIIGNIHENPELLS